jgi:hypothetical protein
MRSSAAPGNHTLLTLPQEIRTMIWKHCQRREKELEIHSCSRIVGGEHRAVMGLCELATERKMPLSLCPLLLVNHQIRQATLMLGKPLRTVQLCMMRSDLGFLKFLDVAQLSLIRRVVHRTLIFLSPGSWRKEHERASAQGWQHTTPPFTKSILRARRG